MKSFINCLILCSLVILVGCSGDSPNQPVQVTQASGDVWQITSLEASDSNPIVGTAVGVIAAVTYNGDPAPDGTQVEFLANGGVFSNGSTTANVLTTGGEASIGFGATEVGVYTIQARVRTVTRQISITYRNADQNGDLQIYSINPNSGSYAGGETVVLTGKGIRNPVAVFFTVQGTQYQAIVDSVVQSVPLTAAGTITARTPEPTAADSTITSAADVKVTVGVGTTDEQSQSYPSVFTYIGMIEPDPDIPPTPVIFGVDPFYGSSAGGETVTILGMNFAWEPPAFKQLEATFDVNQVYFEFNGQRLLAQVERFSETQIEVVTPRFSITPLEDDQTIAVILIPLNGDPEVKRDGIFIVQADVVQPEITGISPTSGPIDGGTIVTISGHGFQLPLLVTFGDLEATEIQLFDDTSLADNDVITCRTPDYSQQGQIPPYFAPIRVTNLQTGLFDDSPINFRYGDNLYISQANPTEGQIGDLFALYGAGFEDPLTVWFRAGGEIEFDVLQVTGTELTLRSPPDLSPTCVDRSGDFLVVLNESGRSAEGGSYTLLGDQPTITSVNPIFVEEIANGDGVDPSEIDIYGVRFADNLFVHINNWRVDPSDVDVESPEHIHVSQIPAPNEFGLVFETASCTTNNGLEGIKNVATPVSVNVRNLPVGCEDTLSQTLVYIPQDQTCRVAPSMQVAIPGFPDTAAGACSPAQQLTITNNGAGTLDIQNLFLQGRFFFDGGAANQNAGPLTIPPFSFDDSLNLYFCPDIATGGGYSGQLTITSNNPGSPNSYALNGTEATPATIGTNPYGDGDLWVFPDTANPNCSPAEILTIANTGVSNLTLQSVFSSDDTQFHVINPPAPNQVLAPLQSYDLQVEFCPTAGAGPRVGTLTIDHTAVNAPDPIVIDFQGNAL
jgi:hypothetical protein